MATTKKFIPRLHEESLVFPNPSLARDDGLLAWGGDLSSERLIQAYSQGIFPWFNENDPILWWSPNPRTVLYPKQMHVSKSLKKSMKHFEIRYDTCFETVIRLCLETRLERGVKSWINEALIESFCALHVKGLAHSVECYKDNCLVGGLYGLYLGGVFCGESMFCITKDASKATLFGLCQRLIANGGDVIDCQLPTPHLSSLGAVTLRREDFLKMLQESLKRAQKRGTQW